MKENRLWVLFARHLSGEASPAELEELQTLLQLYPDQQYVQDLMRNYFNSTHADIEKQEPEDVNFEERFQKIISTEAEGEQVPQIRRSGIRRLLPYAAAVVGIGLAGWYFYQSPKHAPTIENPVVKESEVVARAGARTKMVLPDGTQVWLNSGSKLNYRNDFHNVREVELEGEAFFDVVASISPATGTKIPFVVHASSINIEVVGTAFAVKSYPQDETVEATLLRGIIEVSRKDNPNAPKVTLKPNEKLIFNKQLEPEPQPAVLPVNNQHKFATVRDITITPITRNIPDSQKVETSWMYNRLVFKGERFRDLADKMERWYNVTIHIKNDNLLRYRFSGVFKDETLNEALNALQLTAKFSYQINDNEIEISTKK